MIGHAATIAMRISDGATINFARRPSGMPRERAWRAGGVARTDAASMVLEAREGGGDLPVGLLDRRSGALPTGERVVDVLVDRLGDLRVDRRDRAGLGLRQRLQELRGVRDRLLDVGEA